jgi:4-hydroxy-tetrahydrodipicolinate reductase
VKVAIAGAGGRMGGTLIEALENDGALTLAAALDAPGTAPIGREIGGVKVTDDIDAAVKACDVLIDFTRPQGTMKHLEACVKERRAMVIGTTGLSEEQTRKIRDAGKRIAVVFSPNFAVGVNVLFAAAAQAAAALGDGYDVEIVEAHHRHKVDAPSGTALKLGEVIATALKRSRKDFIFGRQGDTGERPGKQIAIHALRGGDIVGEHTVLFAGVGERLELTVRSQSRMTYANGAMRAAKWLRGKPAGLYDMADVLGLKRP